MKKILLGCESAAETFIPDMLFNDNRFNINYMVGRPVPLYAYLYHEYINNFMGNQVYIFNHDEQPENLFMRMAYSFTAGDMATVVIDENGNATYNWGDTASKTRPDNDKVLEFINNTNAWRKKTAKKYLHTGKMVKALKTEAKEKITFSLLNGQSFTYDKILTSRFMAQDKESGQIFVNYTLTPQTCTVYKEKGYDYFLYSIPEGEAHKSDGDKPEILTIPPLSAVLMEMKEVRK